MVTCLLSKELQETHEKWNLDSGCSKHMIGDKTLFSTIFLIEGGFVSYRDNNNRKILGIDTIGKSPNSAIG